MGPRSSSGFEARIHGVTLSDLVQMECLSGVKRAVRVVSGGNLGHLYIRSGAIVHARTRTLVGEAAALEILSWNDGTVEPVDREWPPKESIQCTWQSLLLRAAQARDERQGQQVVPLRDEGRPRDAGRIDIGETMELQATPLEIGGHVFRAEDFEVVVRIGPSGAVVQNKGASEDFADAVAYACRLTELIGGPLGIERFVAMECVFKQGRCFVVVDGCGEVFALRPGPTADSASIRELFGI
ncbi:MAG TPA: DUF4388 domain-containing protein [Polyangiaceae bacterium]|nr:DUF4388 domain-containing protein [Polyangiaceae bacterium]